MRSGSSGLKHTFPPSEMKVQAFSVISQRSCNHMAEARDLNGGGEEGVGEKGPRGDARVRRWAYAGDEGGLYMVSLKEENTFCVAPVCV